MAGTLPERRRRRLAPLPCAPRESAPKLNEIRMMFSNVDKHVPALATKLGTPEKFQSTYNELTESSSRMRRIVSASSAATESWRMRLQPRAAAESGMVSVTTNSSSTELE